MEPVRRLTEEKNLSGPVRTVGELVEVLQAVALETPITMLDVVTRQGDIYSGHDIGAVQEIAGWICLRPFHLDEN